MASKSAATKSTPKKRRKVEPAWRKKFLEAFADLGIVSYAAIKAGVNRTTVYRARKESAAFEEKYLEAEQASLGKLEQELVRRGRDGTEEPVFYKGDVVGAIKRYSDACLIFALKARAPEIYRERVEVSGNVHHTFRSELDEEIRAITEQLRPTLGGGSGSTGDAGQRRGLEKGAPS
ncbi:MAG: hypothetical protein ACR2M4_02360 [Actinomycetota bacterium]